MDNSEKKPYSLPESQPGNRRGGKSLEFCHIFLTDHVRDGITSLKK